MSIEVRVTRDRLLRSHLQLSKDGKSLNDE